MREFNIIRAPNAPLEMPVVVKITDQNNLSHYESWCYNSLGKKASDNTGTSVWYQARGFFFFKTPAIAAKFMLGAAIGPKGQYNSENDSEFSTNANGDYARGLYNRLSSEFHGVGA